MNIIDKNGRLFGKINVIDFSVILILLFAIPVFVFGYKAMVARDNMQKKWVTVKVKAFWVVPELADVIKPEDAEVGDSGKKIGAVIKIENIVPSSALKLTNDSTHFVLGQDTTLSDITVTLNLLCKNNLGFLYYKGFPVKIGSQIVFSANLYDITGTIIKIERN